MLSELKLPDPRAGQTRLSPELETTVYRLVQEALTNVVKHARAGTVWVTVTVTEADDVAIEVRDDGVGFAAQGPTSGFGLAGIRERVYLAGGTLEIETGAGTGTSLRARLPARARSEGSGAQQAAS